MLIARILTGAILAGVIAGAALFGSTWAIAAVLGLLWLVGAREWSRLAGFGPVGTAVFVVVTLALMAGFAWAGFGSAAAAGAVWSSLAATVLAVAAMVRFPRVFPTPLLACVGLLCLLPSWVAAARLHAFSPALCLAAIVVIWGADVGAYAGGRTFGRHKLARRISPGKTWEGAVAGILTAVLVGFVAAKLLGLPPELVGIAAAGAAVSVIGDLNVSLLKRHAGLKDSGSLLPGHGGVLDRIDGLTTGLPIIAIGLKFAGILD